MQQSSPISELLVTTVILRFISTEDNGWAGVRAQDITLGSTASFNGNVIKIRIFLIITICVFMGVVLVVRDTVFIITDAPKSRRICVGESPANLTHECVHEF